MDEPESQQHSWPVRQFIRLTNAIDDLVLILVALGTLALVFALVYDLILDFVYQEPHGPAYLVNELMLVLIVMELFRQVMRQLKHEPFSLDPFLAIGVIASVRGLLIVQMKVGLGDLDWDHGIAAMMAFAITILLLIAAAYLYRKRTDSGG
jgi:uncharacterized membrane protein (DUF373 family)